MIRLPREVLLRGREMMSWAMGGGHEGRPCWGRLGALRCVGRPWGAALRRGEGELCNE
jgi:hypothetical protein